jgi:RNA polymerase sigma-70 factor, ECF subfamily
VSSGSNSPQNVTQLLRAWEAGDTSALDSLTPLVYDELHRIARRHMSRESGGHTLQATALIHEVYLRLVDLKGVHWRDRAHFFAICARLMRRILIDFARSRESLKRGGDNLRVTLGEDSATLEQAPAQLLVLDRALSKLSQVDPRKGNVVELRFFGGLTVKETAEVLQVSSDTVMRDWTMARAWLLREMDGGAA